MKRMLIALATVAGLAAMAGTARADWGTTTAPAPNGTGPLPTPGAYSGPNTLLGMGAPGPAGPYGLNPALRKFGKFGKFGKGCSTCDGGFGGHGGFGGYGGYGAGGYGGGYGPGYPGAQPPVMQGTLVFPHHPYVRSPRDYFMYDPR